MRITNTPKSDGVPPPPYKEVADASDAASQPVQASLRGGYMRPSLPSEMPPNENNVPSATTYLGSRDHLDHNVYGADLNMLEHTLNFDTETTRDDLTFPLPIETYVARDVTSRDWSIFVNSLLPVHDQVPNGKPWLEKDPQRLSFVGKDTPARRDRILAVIAEWNENFFSPRRVHVNADFSPLPAYPSPRSTALPSAAQVGPRPLQPTQPNVHSDISAQRTRDLPASRHLHRSLSTSSTSSSSSSSSSSVDSIKSKDLEGADLGQIRSALLSFQLNAAKKGHLRASVRQLRDEFRSQRRELGKGSKELKKEYKNQRKEIKKEVKAVVKEAKATRKADRKARRAERRSQREGKRAERRGNDRVKDAQEKGRRAEERAAEGVRRAQERGREFENRAFDQAARAHERARDAQAPEAVAVARARARVADARTRGWDGEAAATQRAQEIRARASAAERRAQETAARARYSFDGEQETGVMLNEG